MFKLSSKATDKGFDLARKISDLVSRYKLAEATKNLVAVLAGERGFLKDQVNRQSQILDERSGGLNANLTKLGTSINGLCGKLLEDWVKKCSCSGQQSSSGVDPSALLGLFQGSQGLDLTGVDV
jgi:hypothetical protein